MNRRRVPRAPLPGTGPGCPYHDTSEDVTPPFSLLWAHAPDHPSPLAYGFPRACGLCRLSPVPADRWSFPTLSLHSLRRRLDPYPAVPNGCARPFLPHRHRPHVTGNTLGETELSLSCNFSRELFFEAAVIRYLQAPTLARPPDCTYRTTSRQWAAGPFTPRIAGSVTCLQLWHCYMSDLGQLT